MKINYTLVAPNAKPLTKAHPEDAGYDLRARTTQTIQPGERTLIGTGVAVKFPAGTVGMVHSRSGLALKGIAVANAPGVVDAGFTGEIGVILENRSKTPYVAHEGDRIAQLVPLELAPLELQAVPHEKFDTDTARGANGFGSTGK